MKKSCCLIVWIGSLLAGCGPSESVAPISWSGSIPLGMERAAENQVLFLYFYAEWCHVCEQMNEDVFPTAEVASALAPYVPVKIDVDQQPAVAETYLADVTPAYVLVDGQGAVRARAIGLMTAEELAVFLNKSATLLEAEQADERDESS